ncbi:hypothetical protein FRC03_009268 [Tulasnella sp. 419]|nr:hypothetical protein FRC03_009268 [Tulasnella sp. 419]
MSSQTLSAEKAAFLEADVAELAAQLNNGEKMSLLGAPNWWNTSKIERLGIPGIRMSDGPNGVRGSSHFLSSPAQCIPCATSLAATFDTELITKVGAFLAGEAKRKAAVALLAPTCNIQRDPRGGRAFESFSEDPHLSGSMAAAYVNGLQKNGVAATIKHFVANDQEHERMAADSIISQRAFREIYLYPFMLAQRDASPFAYMTSYNRVNGIHCSEDPALIGDNGLLRKEWGFDGMIMSDWYGTYAVDEPIKAGLDLEMPGPPRWRTPLLLSHCMTSQKLFPSDIEKRAKNVIKFAQNLAKISPEVVFGDGIERETEDKPESREFNRKAAREGMVLLKNNDGLLPFKAGGPIKKIALIGPNVKQRVISGGGSAFLKANYTVSPYEGLTANAPEGVELSFAVGCYAHKFLPTLEDKLTTPAGKPGWLATFYDHDEEGNPRNEIAQFTLNDTRVKLNDFIPEGLTPTWTIKLKGTLVTDSTGPFEFGLTVSGRAKLWVDGNMTIDNWTKQRPGEFFYGQGSAEEKAVVDVVAGKPVQIDVEYTNSLPPNAGQRSLSQPALMRGVRLGGCPKIEPDAALQEAVDLAKNSDAVIVVAGLTSEWEAEGADRPTLDLPGRQNEVIAKVSEVNPKTVVVLQAGSAISMPWIDSVNSVIQAWYSGNEAGNATSDVIYGKVNPSGRLPISLPRKIQDIGLAHLNSRSENGKIHYREDLFVGYKHYVAAGTKPLFPFGFGLSYTTFSVANLKVSSPSDSTAFSVDVSVDVTNTGSVAGSTVAQLYITLPSTSLLTHPELQLRAFSKIHDIAPGETKTASLKLDKYAVSYWDDKKSTWVAEKGEYVVSVGTAVDDLPLVGQFTVEKQFEWVGL